MPPAQLQPGQVKLAIEVDRHKHFTVNTNQPLGHTVLRRRLLRSYGWKVLSVPYYDWSK